MVLEDFEYVPLGKQVSREFFKTRVVPLVVLAGSAITWCVTYSALLGDPYELRTPDSTNLCSIDSCVTTGSYFSR